MPSVLRPPRLGQMRTAVTLYSSIWQASPSPGKFINTPKGTVMAFVETLDWAQFNTVGLSGQKITHRIWMLRWTGEQINLSTWKVCEGKMTATNGVQPGKRSWTLKNIVHGDTQYPDCTLLEVLLY